jgi:hypothetical protein
MKCLHVVVPRQFYWWTALALIAKEDLRTFHIHLRESIPVEPVSNLIVSSHYMREVGAVDALRRATSAALLCWDGLQNVRVWQSLHVDATDMARVGYFGVGCNRFTVQESLWRPLYDQNDALYRGARPFDSPRLVVDGWAQRRALTWRRPLITLKHARQRPRDVLAPRPRLVFAGQSGRWTLQHLIPSPTSAIVRQAMREIHSFEQFRQNMSFSLLDLVGALRGEEGLRGNDWYLAAKALLRLETLAQLVRQTDRHTLLFYPAKNVNVYQSALRSDDIYLDFGGMNGDERIYPRYADLLVGKRTAVVVSAPPEALYPLDVGDIQIACAIQNSAALGVTSALEHLASVDP